MFWLCTLSIDMSESTINIKLDYHLKKKRRLLSYQNALFNIFNLVNQLHKSQSTHSKGSIMIKFIF